MEFAEAAAQEPPFLNLQVLKRRQIAQGIVLFALGHHAGESLPEFTAGAHITVITPAGMRRNYSLCGNPFDASHWQIAVKREGFGRGGSISLADQVQEGDSLLVSAPHNLFALSAKARRQILIAGGIGITPIYSMVQQLQSEGAAFTLHYCTRDPAGTAFFDELQRADLAGKVHIHHDGGDPARAFDFWPVFERPQAQTHIYCCGPASLMDSVRDMTGHWQPGSVHFESFGPSPTQFAVNRDFSVRLNKTGAKIQVTAGQSLLEALRARGVRVPSSCESGTCGSCKTRLLAGQADHRDLVLGEEERAGHIMVCVSRAMDEELVLDL